MIVELRTKDGDIIKELHRKPLLIANENLKDFNERMNTNITLEYDHYNKIFKIEGVIKNPRFEYLIGEFLIELNRFITLDKHPEFDEKFIKTDYVNRVEVDFNNLKQEIRSSVQQRKGGLSQTEKEAYFNTINELIKLRKDSFPKIVLTENLIIKDCKKEINELCEDLSKELIIKKP